MENLEDLVNLEELYLSHNGLKKIEGLEKNVRHASQVVFGSPTASPSRLLA